MITQDYSFLLSRPERSFNEAAIDSSINGKKILITGAGGSIGSALSRRILSAKPKMVYLLGHGEDSIFQLMQTLDTSCAPFHSIIADTYSDEVAQLLRSGSIDLVCHTSAHKHVGLMEKNPRAALSNNTQTTIWLARKCEEVGTRLVYVSTDKAVKPTTVMGASKKLAEAWIDANGKNAVTIRLGNVLGSAGSLVEIVEGLKRGGTLGRRFTLNHPDMARYFVTAKEAVGLILIGGTDLPGKYTLDMGKPLHIKSLVRQISPGLEITEQASFSKAEKKIEDLFEDDEGVASHTEDNVLQFHRDVEPKLISAVLEIIEDHANSDTSAKELGRLMVDMARKV